MSQLHFKKEGRGEKTLILLHGWPGNLARWNELVRLLENRYTIYRVDFPGWGETPLSRVYTLADYANDVYEFLKTHGIAHPIVVGHSFGGRVAIKLLAHHPGVAEKLILIASAGIERKSFVVRVISAMKPFIPKFLHPILRPLIVSKDYAELDGLKRETFVNVISENLENLLPSVDVPTLLIWGAHDRLTPLWQGRIMEKLLPRARFVLIPDGDHGLPYRRPEEVAQAIIEFA
jgi:pimeloyl-ACP methyl ester carboxylesterase